MEGTRNKRGLKLTTLGAITAIVVAAGSAAGATTEVKISDDAYTNQTVTTTAGSTVHWSRAEGSEDDHNVSQTAGFFRSGDPTEGPIDFSVVFSAGTFPYICEVHGSDMSGVVKVKPVFAAAPTGAPFTVKWATSASKTGSAFDVQYRVGTSTVWKTWKSATTAKSAAFGASGKPVKVTKGKKYTFRVRSRAGSKLSGWSPAGSFTA